MWDEGRSSVHVPECCWEKTAKLMVPCHNGAIQIPGNWILFKGKTHLKQLLICIYFIYMN